MNILVTAASRHGSTREIGAAIAEVLREAGHTVELHGVSDVPIVSQYDAAIVGSAIYMGNWLSEACKFVEGNRVVLNGMPVWLFSSGSVGSDVSIAPISENRVAELEKATHARGHRLFPGKLSLRELGFAERLTVRMVRATPGDFRD